MWSWWRRRTCRQVVPLTTYALLSRSKVGTTGYDGMWTETATATTGSILMIFRQDDVNDEVTAATTTYVPGDTLRPFVVHLIFQHPNVPDLVPSLP